VRLVARLFNNVIFKLGVAFHILQLQSFLLGQTVLINSGWVVSLLVAADLYDILKVYAQDHLVHRLLLFFALLRKVFCQQDQVVFVIIEQAIDRLVFFACCLLHERLGKLLHFGLLQDGVWLLSRFLDLNPHSAITNFQKFFLRDERTLTHELLFEAQFRFPLLLSGHVNPKSLPK